MFLIFMELEQHWLFSGEFSRVGVDHVFRGISTRICGSGRIMAFQSNVFELNLAKRQPLGFHVVFCTGSRCSTPKWRD